MNPVTVQEGGRVVSSERRQESVIEEVPLGLMRRTLITLVDVPVIDGRARGMDSAISTKNSQAQTFIEYCDSNGPGLLEAERMRVCTKGTVSP